MLERKKKKRKTKSRTLRLVYMLCFVMLMLVSVLILSLRHQDPHNSMLDMTRTCLAIGNCTTYWQLSTIDAKQTLEWQATQTANPTPKAKS